MAALTHPPSPALNRAVLHTLGHARIHRGAPLSDLWRALSRDLRDSEARALGESLGLVLPLLVGDRDRLRLAADLTVAIDAYEAADALAHLLQGLPDQELALAAAAVASHPAVPAEVVRAVRRLPVVKEMAGTIRRAFELRLDASAPAETDQEHLLRLQRWPGIDTDTYIRAPVAPVVAVAEEGLPQRLVWRLVTSLREHGAVVRRIPRRFEADPGRGWLGPVVPIIATSSAVLDELRRRGQKVTGQQVVVADPEHGEGATHVEQVVRDVDALLRHFGAPRLRDLDGLVAATADAEVLDRSVFRLGSYTAGELAYLVGSSTNSVYRWSREISALAPDQVEGMRYWGFHQLVALRVYYWLQTNVNRRVPRSVLGGLAEYAGREEGGDVAFTLSGEVFVMEGKDDWHAIHSGQKVLPDVLRVERSFQQFQLGGGATVVPALLHPTSETRVHPAVLGGTPSLRRHRIACAAVARLVDRHGREAAAATYPFVRAEAMAQAIDVGRGILEAR